MNTSREPKRMWVTKPDDKYFFCHYFNMAHHNAFMILKDVTEKVLGFEAAGKMKMDKEIIVNVHLLNINDKSMPDKYQHALDALENRLRFMPYIINGEKPGDTLKTLNALLSDLNEYRNFYSHYIYHKALTSLPKFPIDGRGVSLLSVLGKAVKGARNRFKSGLSEEDKKKVEENFKELYAASFTSRGWKRDFIDLSNPTYIDKRIAFFLCMFLERKHANELLDGIYGAKSSSTKEHQATRESFLEVCCRLPQPKLESSDPNLDALNELDRLPGPLFQSFPKDTKELFKKGELPKDAKGEDSGDDGTTYMRRYDNRFPRFALNFFDETDYIPGMRFQVYLGQFCIESKKKIVGGEKRDRRIIKDISAFGKLTDYISGKHIPLSWLKHDAVPEIKEDVSGDEDEIKTKILMKQDFIDRFNFTPQYQITNNTIGFVFSSVQWPEWNEFSQSERIHFRSPRAPFATISVHELQNLFFYAYLHKNGKIPQYPEPEKYIRRYVHNVQRCISDVQTGKLPKVSNEPFYKITDEESREQPKLNHQKKAKVDKLGKVLQEHSYNIKPSDLPDTVREYLLGYVSKNAIEQLHEKLDAELQKSLDLFDVSRKQEKLEKGKGKRGLTAGKIGTFLAHDFVYMKRGEDMPSDFEFNNLQSYIATFGKDIDFLNKYCQELGITAGRNSHVFLKPIDEYVASFKQRILKGKTRLNANNIVYPLKKFYEDYLYDRKHFFGKSLADLKNGVLPPEDLADLLKIFKIKEKAPADWQYDELHVRLPRGMFNVPIEDAFKNKIKPVRNHEKMNPTYIISQAFAKTQQFYTYDRLYVRGDLQYPGSTENIKNDVKNDIQKRESESGSRTLSQLEELSNLKKLLHYVDENEKEIRQYQTNDRLLWLMLKHVFEQKEKYNLDLSKWDLSKLGAENNRSEKSPLDTEIPMSLQMYNTTVTVDLPIKRYGEFRRIMKDRRLPNLFMWYGETVHLETVKKEIDMYDMKRFELLRYMFEFEKKMDAELPADLKEGLLKEQMESGQNLPVLNHMSYLNGFDTLFKKIPKEKKKQINNLRKCILHNQFPVRDGMTFNHDEQNDIQEQVEEGKILYTKYIADQIIDNYQKILRVVLPDE